MEKFICKECNNQLKLTKGKFIFSFNVECCNNHKIENIDLDDLLNMEKSNQDIFKCKNHKKKNSIHCFDCDEDICFHCYNDIHKGHKIEYLKTLYYNIKQFYLFKTQINKEKKMIDTFISQLIHFQNKFNLYINILKQNIINHHKFICDLINNISEKEFSYIDIKNVEEIFNNNYYKEINNYSKNLLNCETFIKKYDCLKNIFELIIKKGKYIEEQNIKDKYYKYRYMNIIPINSEYYIQLDNYNSNTKGYSYLYIMKKKFNLNSKSFESDIIFKNSFDFDINEIVLKKNNNINKLFSFFLLDYKKDGNYFYKTQIYEITIKDLEEKNNNFIIKKSKFFNYYINLLILSEDKYIIKEYKDFNLYDNLFNKQKIIDSIGLNESYTTSLKINKNTFIFSTIFDDRTNNYNKIYIINIDGKFINKYILKNCGKDFINFYENKKILLSYDNNYFYLINFKSVIPEVIQKIEIINNNEIKKTLNRIYNVSYLLKFLDCFNDDSIYIEITESNIFIDSLFYDITYFIQFKIIEGELREISRIEIERKKIEE